MRLMHHHFHVASRRGRACSTPSREKVYHLTGLGEKSSTTSKTDTNHVICTDVPIHMGGKDSAPQPVELLLSSLIGCTQATALFVGRNMKPRVFIHRMNFDIIGKRDDRGATDCVPINDTSELPKIPARLTCITGSITVYATDKKGKPIEIGDDLLGLLERHTECRCPVANMIVASGCVMDIQWKDGYRLGPNSSS